SLLPDRALSAAAATQTPSPSDSPQPTPAPSGSPMTVDDVQRSVEQSASTGLDFVTGTGLRVAFIILAAVVITFVARRLIRRFARSIAEGHSKRERNQSSGSSRSHAGAVDAAAR